MDNDIHFLSFGTFLQLFSITETVGVIILLINIAMMCEVQIDSSKNGRGEGKFTTKYSLIYYSHDL